METAATDVQQYMKRDGKSTGPFLIGIGGGSGSGKTLIAQELVSRFAKHEILLVEEDSYYRDLSHIPFEQRQHVNFDHPSAFDHDLLLEHLQTLMAGQSVQRPEYDYSQHARSGRLVEISPRPAILLDGILIFQDERIRKLMDIRIFVDADPDIRLARRIRRDISERGRTVESVLEQYEKQVRPMHDLYVEPFKPHADMIIPHNDLNAAAVDVLTATVRARLTNARKG
jgi:uridine kinase